MLFNRYIILALFSGAIAVFCLALEPRHAAADSNVLWNIVNEACVPNQKTHRSPAPCSVVSITNGYAILKDIKGKYQYLLIPTNRVTGIEDPAVLNDNSLNYFADAWNSRTWLESQLHMEIPRQDISLAINSKYARSQNQLHIHIDCVRPDVAAALTANKQEIGTTWSVLALPPAGHKYKVRRIWAANLRNIDPFWLVADQSPDVRLHMARETVVIVGSQFSNGEDGFFLLSDKFDIANSDLAAGVELQDQSCSIVHPR